MPIRSSATGASRIKPACLPLQRFSRNGVTQLSVPFKTSKGPYRIADDTLHLAFEGRPAVTFTIKRDGNQLTTRDAQGREIRFAKFEY